MRQIRKETLNLVVAENFNFPFGIDKDGLYALEITASAKGWWNNLINLRFISFYSDDNLIVKLDNIEFSSKSLGCPSARTCFENTCSKA